MKKIDSKVFACTVICNNRSLHDGEPIGRKRTRQTQSCASTKPFRQYLDAKCGEREELRPQERNSSRYGLEADPRGQFNRPGSSAFRRLQPGQSAESLRVDSHAW